MTSVLVAWHAEGRASQLVGPDPEPLPAGAHGREVAVLHVLTSQDPLGVEQASERNLELLGDLLAWAAREAAAEGWRWWPVTGADVHSGHAEQGIGIAGLSREAAVAAGERWEQLAIYELTPALVRVVTCHGGPDAGSVTAEGPRSWAVPPAGARLPDEGTVAGWWRTYEVVAGHRDVGLGVAGET
jgi:hypothetical protein